MIATGQTCFEIVAFGVLVSGKPAKLPPMTGESRNVS